MNKLETLKDIIADKYDGCYEVTREVFMRGYRNIAYLADPPVYAPGRSAR